MGRVATAAQGGKANCILCEKSTLRESQLHLRENQLWRYSEQCESTLITNALPPNGEDEKKQERDFYQAEQDGKKDKAVEKAEGDNQKENLKLTCIITCSKHVLSEVIKRKIPALKRVNRIP